jgi:hypothetical protein
VTVGLVLLGGAAWYIVAARGGAPEEATPANSAIVASDGFAATVDPDDSDTWLQPAPAMLASLVLAAAPGSDFEMAAAKFASAESLREQSDDVNAVLAYIALIDEHPSSAQARAADSRANYVMKLLDAAELDALEAALPPPEDLKSLNSLVVVGQYHVLRAKQLAASDPAGAARHVGTVYDMAWRAFEEDLDDHYKKTILEEYLLAADMLGKGAETRRALSAHADTLPWTFARWLIKAEIDGAEPAANVVTSQQGLESIRKYYLLKGRQAADPEVASAYYAKCRDLAEFLLSTQPLDVPRFDLAHVYLEAADALGPEAASKAVAHVEAYIESEPLSIMRWIVRYELGIYLVRAGASAAETRAGFAHFEKILVEADTGIVEAVIRDTSYDVEIRGLLACVWGHAFAGTNRVEEASLFYDWVLQYCTPETHPGASAGYAKAVAFERQHADDPAACTAVYEEFVRDHPSSFYGPEALMRVADTQQKLGDAEGALATLARVKREYQNRSATKDIDARIDAVVAESAAE